MSWSESRAREETINKKFGGMEGTRNSPEPFGKGSWPADWVADEGEHEAVGAFFFDRSYFAR